MTDTSMKLLQLSTIILLGILVWQQYTVFNAIQPPIKQSSETEIGRYQLLELSNMRRDRYLVDTKTGRVWDIICDNSTKHSGNTVAPEDCLSESFESISFDSHNFAPGLEWGEAHDRDREEKMAGMNLAERKAFFQEEAARIRTEKLVLMDPEERKAFLQEEESQRQQAH